MAELFISTHVSGLEIYPNPELKPESGWSNELALKQGVKFGNWMGYLDLAAFYMQYDDMMEFSYGPWGNPTTDPLFGLGFKSVNVGTTQISGVEFSASGQGKVSKNITINLLAGYTFMDHLAWNTDEIYAYGFNHGDTIGGLIYDQSITYGNSSSDSSLLKYRYRHIAKIDLETVYKKISVGGSFRYNDFMQNIDKIFTEEFIGGDNGMIPGINKAREQFNNGDFIIDTRVGYQFNNMIRFGLVINNLLNREYMTRPATMMPPRTFAVQCNLKI